MKVQKVFTESVTKLGLLPSIFIYFCIFMSSQSFAEQQTDFSVAAQARSYPLGGSLDLELGHAVMLWGKKESPWMAYVRPVLSSSHTLHFHSGQAAIEIFPFGFLGFKAGSEISDNEQEYDAYNCSTYRCIGTWKRKFLETHLAYKWGSLFFIGRGTLAELEKDDRDLRPLIEPSLGLALSNETERLRGLTLILGKEWSDHWQSIILVQNYHFADVDQSSQYQYLVLRWKNGDWSAQLGGGLARSDLFPVHGSVVGGLRWDILPSWKLF